MQTGSKASRLPEDETAVCPEFESTLLLMDGALAGMPRATALGHARACATCGPLVSDWPAVADALQAHFEDAAELAKPGLAEMPARVLAATARSQRWHLPQWVGNPLLRLPVYGSLGVAAVLVFILQPKPAPPPVVAQREPLRPAVLTATSAPPVAPPAGSTESESENDCHMHQLAFDGADGMVYRTATDGMTVIWVTEHDGA
jgi:hypothetical protein